MSGLHTIYCQKQIADDILDKLYLIDPHSILAGGAVRDWYFDKGASDLDIFFYAPQAKITNIMDELLKKAGFNIEGYRQGGSIPEWYKKNPHLRAIYELTVNGLKVQLIRMSKPTFSCVVPNFPLSLCDAWYKNGQYHYGRHFMRSVKHKCIYKTSEIYANEHQYIKKIRDKFPEYKYYSSAVEACDAILE